LVYIELNLLPGTVKPKMQGCSCGNPVALALAVKTTDGRSMQIKKIIIIRYRFILIVNMEIVFAMHWIAIESFVYNANTCYVHMGLTFTACSTEIYYQPGL
jgi:hypothetical protein